MVEQTPALTPGEAVSLTITPHRSLSRAGFWLFLAAQSLATGAFALAAAWQGNVLAPVFAAIELVLVAFCLNRVLRMSAAAEVVVVGPSRLEVARLGENGPVAQFHPYWAQLRLQPGRWRGAPRRLVVRSHGREIEIGAFLTENERAEVARRLTALLAQTGSVAGVASASQVSPQRIE